ncbi:MAG: hypothetical protein JWN47_174 [Frankiales bacterium]|nr:hypothetical protein [Frankiales bacterium]
MVRPAFNRQRRRPAEWWTVQPAADGYRNGHHLARSLQGFHVVCNRSLRGRITAEPDLVEPRQRCRVHSLSGSDPGVRRAVDRTGGRDRSAGRPTCRLASSLSRSCRSAGLRTQTSCANEHRSCYVFVICWSVMIGPSALHLSRGRTCQACGGRQCRRRRTGTREHA